jgi:hypothetical protein
MRKPTKCRSCNISYELTGKTGRHHLVDVSLICLVCGFNGKSVYHGAHEELHGESFECSSCHNYILYSDGNGCIWKDEIFFPNEDFLIRQIDYHLVGRSEACSLFSFNKKLITLPLLTEWASISELYSKLELLATFM